MGLPTAYQPVYSTPAPRTSKQRLSKLAACCVLVLLALANSPAAPSALEDAAWWLKSKRPLPSEPRERALALLETSPIIGK